MKKKVCLECSKEIAGRPDKRFCSDYCRISFNNQKRSEDKKTIREINKILQCNSEILQRINLARKKKLNKAALVDQGFNFNYFTNLHSTNNGNTYFFCYDFGYRYLDSEDEILVVKKFNS